MEPYRSYYPHARLLLPHTEALASRAFSLPNGTSVDSDAVATICRLVRLAVTNHREIRCRWEHQAQRSVPVA